MKLKNFKKKYQDSKIYFTDQPNDERIIWDLIDERNGGIMLRNAISKRYLKCSPDSQLKHIDVVGNPQTHLNRTHTASKVQLFEGLWVLKKIQDHILQIEKERNRNL